MFAPFLIALVCFSALSARAVVPGEAPGKRFALLPLRADGIAVNEARRLEAAVRAAAAQRAELMVQAESLTTDFIDSSQSLGVKCDVDTPACVAELGRIMDAELVMSGRATRLPSSGGDDGGTGGDIGVTLELVDVATATRTRVVRGLVTADVDTQGAAMTALAALVFDANDGTLGGARIVVPEEGAAIALDGEALGASPLAAPVDGLAAGRHIVVVTKKGFIPITRTIELKPGERVALHLPLTRDPDAIVVQTEKMSPVIPLSIGVGGALVAVGGVVALVIGAGPALAIDENERALAAADQNAVDFPTTAAELRSDSEARLVEWNEWGQATVVTGATLATVGLVAAVVGFTWSALE